MARVNWQWTPPEGESGVIYLRHSVCRPIQLGQDRYRSSGWFSVVGYSGWCSCACDTGRELLVSRSRSGMTGLTVRSSCRDVRYLFDPPSPELIDFPQINRLDADLIRSIYLRQPRKPADH